MQTIKIKYTIDDNDKLLLNDYIRQYNHVYRVAFNNLQSHKVNKLSELTNLNNIDFSNCDINSIVMDIYSLKGIIINSWQCCEIAGIIGVKVKN